MVAQTLVKPALPLQASPVRDNKSAIAPSHQPEIINPSRSITKRDEVYLRDYKLAASVISWDMGVYAPTAMVKPSDITNIAIDGDTVWYQLNYSKAIPLNIEVFHSYRLQRKQHQAASVSETLRVVIAPALKNLKVINDIAKKATLILKCQSNFSTKVALHLRQLKAKTSLKLLRHPLQPGQIFYSPGGVFKYRVVGACCRLYDRENLPYPSCSLEFKGKQPSWRWIGVRFVPDVAAKRSPSYCVELVDYPEALPMVITLHWMKLSLEQQQWWYSKRLPVVAVNEPILTTTKLKATANVTAIRSHRELMGVASVQES